jgi:hypothetical protein
MTVFVKITNNGINNFMIRLKWIPDTVHLRPVGHEASTEISRQIRFTRATEKLPDGQDDVNLNFILCCLLLLCEEILNGTVPENIVDVI